MEVAVRSSWILLWLGRSVYCSAEGPSELFACHNLSNAHYNYLKPPGESVTITCPKNCSAGGNTQWYHSYVKVERDLRLLVWSGSVHEAAVTETPTHGSVGFFCCVCEEEEEPAREGCCWGVAYQPVVNLTITATEGALTNDEETVVLVGRKLSLRCEVRGFPRVSIALTPPAGFNTSLAECREVEKSWYSSVMLCSWTASEADSGVFECTGTIQIDSLDNEIVDYNETASHQLSIYKPPKLLRLYQASKVGSRLDIVCEVDCSPHVGCSVMWYFEWVEVDTTSGKYEVSSRNDGVVHQLSVVNPGKGELGRYSCVLRSRFSANENSSTITITLPDGAEPTPMKDLPGPVRDRESQTSTTTALTVMYYVVFVATITFLIAVAIFAIRRIVAVWQRVRTDTKADTVELIQAQDGDDIEKDGVALGRRRGTPRGRRSRRRPSDTS